MEAKKKVFEVRDEIIFASAKKLLLDTTFKES